MSNRSRSQPSIQKDDGAWRIPRRLGVVVVLVVGLALGSAGVTLASNAFSDVPDTNPFHDDIGWMAETGISTGFTDGTYRPADAVSRQAMSAFMRRLAGQAEGVAPVVDAATVEGLSAAQLQGQQGPAGPAGPQGAPATALWAVVNADGTLARGSEAVVSTAAVGSSGGFEVIFDRDVTACAFVASTGLGESEGTPPAGSAGTVRRALQPNGVYIQTWDMAGAGVARGFHLSVLC